MNTIKTIKTILFFIMFGFTFLSYAESLVNYEDLNKVQNAFNDSDPKENIIYYDFDNESIYKVRMRIGTTTAFIISSENEIEEYNLGMSSKELFTIHKSDFSNVLLITPNAAGFDTTLAIIDSGGKIYQYYLRVDNVHSEYVPHLKVFVVNSYANGELSKGVRENKPSFNTSQNPSTNEIIVSDEANQTLDDTKNLNNSEIQDYIFSASREKTNFAYKYIGGNIDLRPTIVFDDGINTYFVFRSESGGKPKTLPNIYKVVDGIDSPVTQRETMSDGTIIIKTVARNWSIRSGDSFFCLKRGEQVES